jgi:hypothetical protein
LLASRPVTPSVERHRGGRVEWPDKQSREQFEITEFVEAYARLPGSPQLAIVRRGEKPDFIVGETATGRESGVELTSVYIDDRSVPDVHLVEGEPADDLVPIPFDKAELERYQRRLLSAIQDKIRKARTGYDTTRPLILAIYINEYIGIYLGKSELDDFVRRHEPIFDAMAPFVEVVFWNLGNGGIFRVKPN